MFLLALRIYFKTSVITTLRPKSKLSQTVTPIPYNHQIRHVYQLYQPKSPISLNLYNLQPKTMAFPPKPSLQSNSQTL